MREPTAPDWGRHESARRVVDRIDEVVEDTAVADAERSYIPVRDAGTWEQRKAAREAAGDAYGYPVGEAIVSGRSIEPLWRQLMDRLGWRR
jgi:hypothetical protein